MTLNNNSRFTILKDAYIYLEKNKIYNSDLQIAETKDFSIEYNWDEDFRKYFRINTYNIKQIEKFYSKMDIFLKNIYWENIYWNLEKIIKDIYLEINEKTNLFIINMSPLEMAIIWKLFEELWLKNIVYNFNKQIKINSSDKTLEASLYIMAYKNSKYFIDKTKELIKKLSLERIQADLQDKYIIFDENNSTNKYNFHQIDNYLKWQISFWIAKNVYRLDKYPEINFLIQKNIKNISIFDNDNDLWWLNDYYIDKIKKEDLWIKIKKIEYKLNNNEKIWFYEDYLIEKDKEFKIYKNSISEKTQKTVKDLNIDINKYKPINWINNINTEENKKLIPLLILFPMIVFLFFERDLWVNTSSSNNWIYTNTIFNWWWVVWPSIWGNTSNNINSNDSSSIIKSFWWGWFSKWTSSS